MDMNIQGQATGCGEKHGLTQVTGRAGELMATETMGFSGTRADLQITTAVMYIMVQIHGQKLRQPVSEITSFKDGENGFSMTVYMRMEI